MSPLYLAPPSPGIRSSIFSPEQIEKENNLQYLTKNCSEVDAESKTVVFHNRTTINNNKKDCLFVTFH